jgi:hypothetical protein
MTTLFDPALLEPAHCATCGAIRTTGQDRVPTCAYDLQTHMPLFERDHPKRPRNCLNSQDPQTAKVPY